MGNCLGKGKKGGQVLGTTEQRSSLHQYETSKSQATRRTGNSSEAPGPGRPVGEGNPTAEDPRAAAAQAAENSSGGELSAKLNQERNKNRTQLLKESSRNRPGSNEELIYD
ncbi:hypothetical protein TRICI_001666 [Trichomonascus ciferrii]|uniref:Uncharacterized protein n=1 Tax=Trichomonascus ciferrii TaxID=44093 RepID=A0A642VCA5_9ASCO|nr:hypothetical protein TRICI_001666 [Trichomonascus ciferrii]